jgi:hypothetical protein
MASRRAHGGSGVPDLRPALTGRQERYPERESQGRVMSAFQSTPDPIDTPVSSRHHVSRLTVSARRHRRRDEAQALAAIDANSTPQPQRIALMTPLANC